MHSIAPYILYTFLFMCFLNLAIYQYMYICNISFSLAAAVTLACYFQHESALCSRITALRQSHTWEELGPGGPCVTPCDRCPPNHEVSWSTCRAGRGASANLSKLMSTKWESGRADAVQPRPSEVSREQRWLVSSPDSLLANRTCD